MSPAAHPAGASLSLRQLNRTTLLRQSLLERTDDGPAEAIARLAGLQAQHANSPYVALWSRVRDLRIADLEAALADRSVVKATLMRTTLHLVAAVDYGALDAATADGRAGNWDPTARRAGVHIGDLHRALLAFAGEPRTVDEMDAYVDTLTPGGRLADHAPAGGRNAAFRVASSPGGLVHVPPSGMWESFAKPRYVEARIWLPGVPRPSTDEALRLAAERYLAAYGPASLDDFVKWVGARRVTHARAAIASLGDRLVRSTDPDGRELLDLEGLPLATGDEPAPGRFLSRWDSVLIGYDRRERILPAAVAGEVIRARNGDFLPAFTVDGFVAGTWSVAEDKGEAVLTLSPLDPVGPADRTGLEEEAERLVRYVAAEASRHEVRWA